MARAMAFWEISIGLRFSSSRISDRNLLFQGGVGRGIGIGEEGGLGGERGVGRMNDEGKRRNQMSPIASCGQ